MPFRPSWIYTSTGFAILFYFNGKVFKMKGRGGEREYDYGPYLIRIYLLSKLSPDT